MARTLSRVALLSSDEKNMCESSSAEVAVVVLGGMGISGERSCENFCKEKVCQ